MAALLEKQEVHPQIIRQIKDLEGVSTSNYDLATLSIQFGHEDPRPAMEGPQNVQISTPEPHSERNEVSPKLYFRKNMPYDHIVIPRSELHPIIGDYVDEIRQHVNFSRAGVVPMLSLFLDKALFHSQLEQMYGGDMRFKIASSLFHAALFGSLGYSLHLVSKLGSPDQRDRFHRIESFEKGAPGNLKEYLDSLKGSLLRTPYFSRWLPYLVAGLRTKAIGVAIHRLSDRGEAPFQRNDCQDILSTYHFGVVDNAGQLVLFKDPFDKYQPELNHRQSFVNWLMLHQPFQRTWFEVTPPTYREKVSMFAPNADRRYALSGSPG